MINYGILPKPMQDSMRMYIEDGILPGAFLRAVLENNLVEAFQNADDTNKHCMRDFVRFICNEAPIMCWRSKDFVRMWSQYGGLKGIDRNDWMAPVEKLWRQGVPSKIERGD